MSPFANRDPRKVVQKIVASSPDFKMFGSELRELKDLLAKMLVKDPTKRLRKLSEVRKHPWFANHINFADIEARKVKAPTEPVFESE